MRKEKLKLKLKISLVLLGTVFTLIALELGLQGIALINSRTDQMPIVKDDKQTRIICIGDSFTYGIGAKKGFSYPEQLDRLLDQRFEVTNFGQPGFNTAQCVQRAQKKIAELNPETLIIMCGLNDYWNLSAINQETPNWGLKLKSIISGSRLYRLLSISALNLSSKKYHRNRLSEDEIEFITFIKYGRHYQLSKQYEKALFAFDAALRTDYFNSYVFVLLDELFIDWQNVPKAINYFEMVNNEFPENGYVYMRLGRLYKSVQDYKKSKEFFKKALALDPGLIEAGKGIKNADLFLGQNISRNFQISSLNVIKKSSFNEQLKLDTEDYAIMKFIKNSKNKHFSQSNDYLSSIEVIYKRQLFSLISLCRENNIKILFLSYPEFVRDYVYSCFSSTNTDFIDLRLKFTKIVNNTNRSEYFSQDGHCTKKGYELIAEIVYDYIVNNNIGRMDS